MDAELVSETGATPRLTGPGRPRSQRPLHAPDLVLVEQTGSAGRFSFNGQPSKQQRQPFDSPGSRITIMAR
jgi:hypothetical protein